MNNTSVEFEKLLSEIRRCTHCADHLPFPPRPVIRASTTARLLIVGQAPGMRVHLTGLSFNDPSGDRLRQWLGIDRNLFYNENLIALMPMGLCYPGKDKNGGDRPPCRECTPLWHPQVHPFLSSVDLTLLVGRYAQLYYLKNKARITSTETIRAWKEYLPHFLPLPHPSWRNNTWLKKNLWFEEEIIPYLQNQIKIILDPILS